MTIIDLDSGKPVEGVLQRGNIGKGHQLIVDRLADDELSDIRQKLDQMIISGHIHTAGWMPGKDWRGTPFQALYKKAAKSNVELAAKLFGIMVWEAFERSNEDWFTGRFDMNGEEIGSRTYWKRPSDGE